MWRLADYLPLSGQPFLPKLPNNLFMGNRPTGLDLCLAALHRLQHVKVVEHVVDAAVIG